MKTRLGPLLLLTMALLLFSRCARDHWDSYYERPDWLENPIYEILKEDGRFTAYLRCVDSTKYARILQSASYYTVFAPTDSAFAHYLQEHNYASIADISKEEADTIVSYSLVYNVFDFEQLSDVLSSGWDTLSSIKKKTAFYRSIYRDRLPDSTDIWAVDTNSGTSYVVGDNNYKYVPTYMQRYFDLRGFLPMDYEYFYPDRVFSGDHVQGAKIVTANMYAENGVVHAVDRVNKPLPNLEVSLQANPAYSKVIDYLNRRDVAGDFIYKSYTPHDAVTNSFREIYPELNLREVYVKNYSFPLALNTERLSNNDKVAETGGYTFVVPTNAAVDSFYMEKIKPYYDAGKNPWQSIEDLPTELMDYFMQAHISESMVWPSKYQNSMSMSGEFFNGQGGYGKSFDQANFVEVKVTSNGFLYGTDDYVHSKYFETVYTQLMMDSTYSMMHSALKLYYQYTLMDELMRCPLNGYDSEYYMLLLMPDQALTNNGYTYQYSTDFGQYVFSNADAVTGDLTAEERLKRLIRNCVFVRIKNDRMDTTFENLFQNGMSAVEGDPGYSRCFKEYGFEVMLNYYGDMTRFKCPSGAARLNRIQVQTLGSYDATLTGTSYNVASQLDDIEFSNGVVYDMGLRLPDYCNPVVSWNEKSLGQYINDICAANVAQFSEYKKYVQAVLFSYDSDNKVYTNPIEIENTARVTVLMPNNDAMRQAVVDGYLPSYEAITQSSSPTYAEDVEKARGFLLYHILDGRVFLNDLNPYHVIYSHTSATYQTSVTQPSFFVPEPNQPGNIMMVEVSKNAEGNLQFSSSPETSLVAGDSTAVEVILGATSSNYYARKGVIHGIDGYLPCNPIIH